MEQAPVQLFRTVHNAAPARDGGQRSQWSVTACPYTEPSQSKNKRRFWLRKMGRKCLISMVVDAVRCEPVSASKFPVKQGN